MGGGVLGGRLPATTGQVFLLNSKASVSEPASMRGGGVSEWETPAAQGLPLWLFFLIRITYLENSRPSTGASLTFQSECHSYCFTTQQDVIRLLSSDSRGVGCQGLSVKGQVACTPTAE